MRRDLPGRSSGLADPGTYLPWAPHWGLWATDAPHDKPRSCPFCLPQPAQVVNGERSSRESEEGQYLWQSLWQFVAMGVRVVPIPASPCQFMPRVSH